MEPPVHKPCRTPAVFKSVLDDSLVPALIPWCPQCDGAIGIDELDGDMMDIACDLQELLDHMRLERISQQSERSPS